ncbi:MAG: hypothetical protein KGJ90_05150 [Patescibacteria group bacterium]|nr:hypothetical protein [Patescibacteria group bacterium]
MNPQASSTDALAGMNELEVEDALLEAARQSLDQFVASAFAIVNPGVPYQWNWHIACLCAYLEAAYRGEEKRLIFNMPPRELKSFVISVCFPAWVLGHKPHEKFIVASHSLRPLAAKLSSDTARLMRSEWYKKVFPNTILEKETELELRTTHNGHRIAFSMGGITGLGANYLIGDDLNKPDEALSDVIRKGVNTWVDETFMSRLDNRIEGRCIFVQQRVHENDVTGHLLEKGGYTHVKFPAEAYSDIHIEIGGETFGMAKGDLLHPERLPREILDDLRYREIGEYAFSGQYLQEPVPPGGGLFKDKFIQYYDQEDFSFAKSNGFILCDPAGVGTITTGNTKRKKSDWTAFMVVALAPDQNYYLVDMVRDKFNPTERIDALFELHQKWTPFFGKPLKVGYESYGLQSDLHYIQRKQKEESYRFNLIPLAGKMAKEDRIARLIPHMETGRWYFPVKIMYKDSSGRTFDLVREMIDGEMRTFPLSKHDDCIDALSRIYDEDMEANFPLAPKRLENLIGRETRGSGSDHWIGL